MHETVCLFNGSEHETCVVLGHWVDSLYFQVESIALARGCQETYIATSLGEKVKVICGNHK